MIIFLSISDKRALILLLSRLPQLEIGTKSPSCSLCQLSKLECGSQSSSYKDLPCSCPSLIAQFSGLQEVMANRCNSLEKFSSSIWIPEGSLYEKGRWAGSIRCAKVCILCELLCSLVLLPEQKRRCKFVEYTLDHYTELVTEA